MDASAFMDKDQIPSDHDLQRVLGEKYELWMEIRLKVLEL